MDTWKVHLIEWICISDKAILLCCMELIIPQKSYYTEACSLYANCITATVKETAAYYPDVTVRWQAVYVPLYAVEVEEITNIAK